MIISNIVRSEFSQYIKSTSKLDAESLRTRSETAALHRALVKLTDGLHVVKIKIYNLDGLTVFSSDAHQIGEDKRDNPGFIMAATQGLPASELSYRDEFSAFSTLKLNRSVVESYIPVTSQDGSPEWVFELYTDVTARVASIQDFTIRLSVGLLMFFTALYAVLFLVVRRADKILKSQYSEREQAEKTLMKREEDLRVALREAETANGAKAMFLARMSHELRTPLGAIIGLSEAIFGQYLGTREPRKYIEYAGDIKASGEHLLDLINDILDLSAIDAGKQTLHKERLNFRDVIEQCNAMVAGEAERSGNLYVSSVPDDLPLITADQRALKQIFINILANAIKFTPKGGSINLSTKVSKDTLIVSVRDTGMGIPAERLDEITEPFVRGESSPYVSQEGTGLGLAIVKSLVELHGGALTIESQVGQGTKVTVELPIQPS